MDASTARRKVDAVSILTEREQVKQLGPLTSSHGSEHPAEYIPNSPIRILRTIAACRAWTASHARRPRLVPTMGALHEGHLSLIRAAWDGSSSQSTEVIDGNEEKGKHVKDEAAPVVVSIYVNPAQFGISEDLASYPKTWDEDCRILRELYDQLAAKAHESSALPDMAVFAPTTAEMYPSGFPGQEIDSKGSFVTITPVGELLEGKSRPTFFRGVATVCMKLFNIVQPDKAYFGQKDIQQTVVIKKMVKDLCMPIDVRVIPTVREDDGLALSSRNVYLGERRRKIAVVLSRALRAAEDAYTSGRVCSVELLRAALQVVSEVDKNQMVLPPSQRVRFEVDYISVADPETMEEVKTINEHRGAIVSGAVRMLPVEQAREGEDLGHSGGPSVRLIDNIILQPR